MRLGLTGGISTGKNLISKYFIELGAYVIDYDEISRSVVEPGLPAWHDMVNYFGQEVLQKDGSIDRAKIGMIVFNNNKKLKKLESFTHPRIIAEAKKRENEIIKVNPGAVIIHNVPLLFETGMDKSFDITIAIHIDKKKQLDRLIKRDGMSKEEAMNRIKSHFSTAEKTQRADYIIDNNGSMEETKQQVQELYSKLYHLAVKNGD